jgi:hypothetical protein
MFCFTPNVSVCNTTRPGSSRAVRSASSSSDADKDNKKMVLSILGFILDGDTNYDNLSKHADLPNRLEAYEPPVLTKLESTLQYQKGVPLEIKVCWIMIVRGKVYTYIPTDTHTFAFTHKYTLQMM